MKDHQLIACVNVLMDNHSYCNTCLLLQIYLAIHVVIQYGCSHTNCVCMCARVCVCVRVCVLKEQLNKTKIFKILNSNINYTTYSQAD